MAEMVVTELPGGGWRLQRGAWSDVVDLRGLRLRHQAAVRNRDRDRGRYAEFYAQEAEALAIALAKAGVTP